MNNELNIVATEPISAEDAISEYMNSIQNISMDAQGLSVLINNLYHELENGNRCLTPSECYDEAMSALSFIRNAVKHIEADLDEATRDADMRLLALHKQKNIA